MISRPPLNYLVPSPNVPSWSSEPFRSGRASVAATFLVFVLTLSAGTPGFAQNPAPAVEDMYLVSSPADGVYVLGNVVEVHVRVNRVDFVVTGQPRVALTIGADTRYAEFQNIFSYQGERRYLEFNYVVQASDRDDDGISIPANALTLNGGSIEDADGNDADLSHGAVPDDSGHKVDGSVDPSALPPTVTQVEVYTRPSSGDTFGPGDEVRASVTFSKPVVVTGDLRLVLQMGDQARSADLFFVSAEGAYFRYFVKASDRDDDGIGIPANAVRLNGGSIRDSAGNDADLTHEAVPDDPQRKVDGRLDAIPTITDVFPGSRPRDGGDTFGRGDSLRVRVHFSELVDVTGAPQLTIQVGTQARQADLHLRQGTILYFEHIVQSSDVDADGYSVPADALSLNGGSIRDADGNDADLTHAALAADPQYKVNGASGVPTVAYLFFSRSPASQDTYVAGETIFVYVAFSRRVHVTGAPQLTIQVGARARRANHLPRRRAAQLLPPQGSGFHGPEQDGGVYFEYVVQPSDVDDDGISVPANALTLNGGSIRAVDDDSDASLSHDGLADDPTRKVDGTRSDDQAPTVLRFFVEPPVHGTFGGGDAIVAQVSFSEGVTMTGAPRLALRIGAETRFATFRERWGTTSLLFEYVVDESDRDDDGISIAADAFDLNGGTIQDNAGNDASVDLGYRAFNDDPNFKVDGGLTPVPALPLGGVLALLFALLGGGWRRLARQPERRR